jgi:hypothetical protein
VTVSTPTLVDQRVHAVAVKAALNTALTGDAAAYDYDEVPGTNGNAGTLPNIYVALSVERRGALRCAPPPRPAAPAGGRCPLCRPHGR